MSQTRGSTTQVRVVATLGGATRRKASSTLKALDAFGVELVEDTCWCMLTHPVVPPSSGRLAPTDSAKYAHYAPGLVGRRPRLASRAVVSRVLFPGVLLRGGRRGFSRGVSRRRASSLVVGALVLLLLLVRRKRRALYKPAQIRSARFAGSG